MTGKGQTSRDAAAVAEFVERVRARLGEGLLGIRLFGSKAHGDAPEDSDIDIAVIVRGDRLAAENTVIDMAFDINLTHDVYISPRVILADVLQHPVWRITHFVQALEHERFSMPSRQISERAGAVGLQAGGRRRWKAAGAAG